MVNLYQGIVVGEFSKTLLVFEVIFPVGVNNS